ncbi:MAG TPA: MEDS domain-containing protein [Egibacteraceae bacterium]|nr:MEDS domain-containing protein [Egibacteraceae bacterium]
MTASLVAGQSSRHVCAVTRTDAARARITAGWIREGLELGERVVWVEPPGGPVLGWLDAGGFDWRGPLASGALRLAPPEDVLLLDSPADIPARLADARALTAQALRDGHSGLRVGADTAVALTVMAGVDAQLRFEAAWEELTRVERLSLLCLYDPAVHGEHLDRGIALHPREFTDGLAVAAAAAGTVEIGGDLDLSNAAMVGAFLRAADLDAGPGDRTLDLRACAFVDIAGADRLVAFARAAAPRRVRVLGPPPTLRRILELTGGGELELVGGPR